MIAIDRPVCRSTACTGHQLDDRTLSPSRPRPSRPLAFAWFRVSAGSSSEYMSRAARGRPVEKEIEAIKGGPSFVFLFRAPARPSSTHAESR